MPELPNEFWFFLASLVGASINLMFLKEASRRRQFGAVGTGLGVGWFVSPPVAEFYVMTIKFTTFLHFLVGFGGFALASGLFKVIQSFQTKPIKTLGEIAKTLGEWFVRMGTKGGA